MGEWEEVETLKMSNKDQMELRERVIHTMYNEHGLMYDAEVNEIKLMFVNVSAFGVTVVSVHL